MKFCENKKLQLKEMEQEKVLGYQENVVGMEIKLQTT